MQRIASALSTAPAAEDAALEAVRDVEAALGGAEPDLAYLFLSPSHLAEVEIAAALVRERLRPARLLCCVAEGVVGGRRELESGAGLWLWAGAFPGARVDTFHLEAVPAEEGVAVAGVPDFDDPALVTMLVDPFTFPAGGFLRLLNEEHEGLPLVGGFPRGPALRAPRCSSSTTRRTRAAWSVRPSPTCPSGRSSRRDVHRSAATRS